MEKSEYSGVINIFMDGLAQGRPLTIYGDGNQIRDFVYVKDIVQALLLAAEKGVPGSTYNVGSGSASSIRELAEILLDVTNTRAEIRYAPFRAGEVLRSAADIRVAQVKLGYQPEYSLSDGLREIWACTNDTRTPV
jgi:UDP-glucose 4-epimerase